MRMFILLLGYVELSDKNNVLQLFVSWRAQRFPASYQFPRESLWGHSGSKRHEGQFSARNTDGFGCHIRVLLLCLHEWRVLPLVTR